MSNAQLITLHGVSENAIQQAREFLLTHFADAVSEPFEGPQPARGLAYRPGRTYRFAQTLAFRHAMDAGTAQSLTFKMVDALRAAGMAVAHALEDGYTPRGPAFATRFML